MHIELGMISLGFAFLMDIFMGIIFLIWYIARGRFLSLSLMQNIPLVAVLCCAGDLLSFPWFPLDIHLLFPLLFLCVFSYDEIFIGQGMSLVLGAFLGDGGFLNLGVNAFNNLLILPFSFYLFLFLIRFAISSDFIPKINISKNFSISRYLLLLSLFTMTLALCGCMILSEYFISSYLFGYPGGSVVRLFSLMMVPWMILEGLINSIVFYAILRSSNTLFENRQYQVFERPV